jgi:hypothetical protein
MLIVSLKLPQLMSAVLLLWPSVMVKGPLVRASLVDCDVHMHPILAGVGH